MRILIPTVDYPPIEGGISTVALEVSRALHRQGHEVTVVAPWFPDMESFDAAEPCTIVRFGGYNTGWFRLFPLLWKSWPKTRGVDLIIAINVSYGGVLGRLARMFRGNRYINLAYAYEFLKFKNNPFAKLALRSIYRHGEHTVAISRFTRENLIHFGVDEGRVRMALPGANLPEPVDQRAVDEIRLRFDLDDYPFILSVGRFIPRKGQITLVEALPILHETCHNVHLVLVGRGPELENCRRKAEAFGMEGFVHLPGYLPDETLQTLYQSCACFALPTGEDEDGQVEGFGLVFTEAQAHGKAVVAGRSGGVVDAVLHEKTGLLIPPDDPDRLAEALRRILEEPELAAALGSAGRKRVEEQLNWDVFARKLVEGLESGPRAEER
jgi:phosphatidylinositol alpha-1,6-mannosyltransferase